MLNAIKLLNDLPCDYSVSKSLRDMDRSSLLIFFFMLY